MDEDHKSEAQGRKVTRTEYQVALWTGHMNRLRANIAYCREPGEGMKTLMIDVVQKTYEFIQELFDVENGGKFLLRLAARDPVPQWEDPR
jgi:hypothetical protein